MNNADEHFASLASRAISHSRTTQPIGKLTDSRGILTATVPAFVGEMVSIKNSVGDHVQAEVIGFSGQEAYLMPFSDDVQLQTGNLVTALGHQMQIPVGFELMGRVIDAVGNPLDDAGPLNTSSLTGLKVKTPNSLQRTPVSQAFTTGQRTIDGLLSMGKGQRVGLFAGSGVGKSTLMGEIAKYASSDINVVALIGERGREVLPFIQEALGEEGMRRSILIVSTANEPSLSRVRAAETAVAIAHWFREQGKDVFLMLDSITRFAMAQRDLGLRLGEPPTSRGYTPSVFQKLGHMLEQLGNSNRGTITALLTVLVDGDDLNDPISDAVRSIVDGHIVLDRGLANAGHFPAIDVLKSASRLFQNLASAEHLESARVIRQSIARYFDVLDLVQVGAYQKGRSYETDLAIDSYPKICKFLTQNLNTPSSHDATMETLLSLAKSISPAPSSIQA